MQARLGCQGELEDPPKDYPLFPREAVLAAICAHLSGQPEPLFAIICTDYFGGVGNQWARLYRGIRRQATHIERISPTLEYLGVIPKPGMDAFDTVGLSAIRRPPESLQKYIDLSERL